MYSHSEYFRYGKFIGLNFGMLLWKSLMQFLRISAEVFSYFFLVNLLVSLRGGKLKFL